MLPRPRRKMGCLQEVCVVRRTVAVEIDSDSVQFDVATHEIMCGNIA
jgi:hypothetical protein